MEVKCGGGDDLVHDVSIFDHIHKLVGKSFGVLIHYFYYY